NIAGLISVAHKEFWWGPSRAISIGITEFPAWSFLLGDLHPHYLSYILAPAFYLIALEASPPGGGAVKRMIVTLLYLACCEALLSAANSWDVVGFGLLAIPFVVVAWRSKRDQSEFSDDSTMLIPIATMMAIITLAALSNSHIQPAPIHLRWVSSELPRI